MNIPVLRLQHQKIIGTRFDKAEQVVVWLGGIQGQDYHGAKCSIGLRMAQATDVGVTRAIDEGTLCGI